jgi:hypothetical protein
MGHGLFRPGLGAAAANGPSSASEGAGYSEGYWPLLIPGEAVHNEASCRTWVSPSG